MLAQLIYLRVFRRHMDYATGTAGLTYRIDYQTICDAVSFLPDPGSQVHRWTPTKGEVRATIRELERVLPDLGRAVPLLIDAGSNPHRGYLKRLPLASMDPSVQKGNDAGTTQERRKTNDTRNPPTDGRQVQENHGDAVQERHDEQRREKTCCTAMNVTPPVSGKPEEEEEVLTHVSITDRQRCVSRPVALVHPVVTATPPDAATAAGTANPDHRMPGPVDRRPAIATPTWPTLDVLPVSAPRPDPVERVFAHWQQTMQKPRAKLDAKRRAAIAARLKDGYTLDDLLAAVDGCKASAWHQGKNERQRAFDDLSLICRDGTHVDQFLDLAHGQRHADAKLSAFLNAGIRSQALEGEFHVV